MTVRNRFAGPIAVVSLLAALAFLAGCGDNDSSSPAEEEHESVTPAKAIGEITQVRIGLGAGLAAYQQGEAEKADQLVGDAYLEHFELVEGPLEARDEELSEELEELIREEIRAEIQDGAKPSQVAKLVEEANHGLNEAEKALKG